MTRQFLPHANTASNGLLIARISGKSFIESLCRLMVSFLHICFECVTWHYCVDRTNALQHRSTPDFFHVNLLNTFQDWVDLGLTTVRIHQLRPTEMWCYNWRLEDRIASFFSPSHDYVIMFVMGNVPCFLVYIAATCTVGVCVSVHRLKRINAEAI